jgi:hypothetical protein
VMLTLAENEAIIGAALPSAAHARSFWKNSPRGGLCNGRGCAGWRVPSVHHTVALDAVTFVRAGPGTTR